MPQYSITATSASVDYEVKRTNTEDGSDTVYKDLEEAQLLADHWVATLNEENFANASDWVASVKPSSK
jgi:hypothetical protein